MPSTMWTARRGLLLVLLAGAAFFATWWNGYMPPTSGGEAVILSHQAAGFWPYRDYFFQAPPGMPMLVQAIGAVAGPRLIAILTAGALLRLCAAAALYGLLLRLARPSYAAMATMAALVVSSADISDTPFYYNHVGTAAVLIGTFVGLRGATIGRSRGFAAALASGALLTFAVCIKQTMVFGSAAAGLTMIVLAYPRPKSGWILWIAGLAAGVILCVGGVWFWLASHGLVDAMVYAMRAAPQAKGGILRSMARPLLAFRATPLTMISSIVAWAAIAGGLCAWRLARAATSAGRRLATALAFLFLIVVGALVIGIGARSLTLLLTALGWWGSLTLAVMQLRTWRDPRARAMLGLGVLAFGIGYCFAVSWPLFENMALAGVAVLLAVVFEEMPKPARRRTAFVCAVAVVCIASGAYRKFTAPQSWGHWVEPPLYSARGSFDDPMLAGIRLSRPAAELYRLTRDVATRHTSPGEPIYVFPDLTILYAIANRPPATYALAHVVDTSPPFLGAQDAARLRNTPPAVLIIREDLPASLKAEEDAYLGGGRSSVRDVLDALSAIEPMYDRVAVFTDQATPPIEFYVRDDLMR